MVNFRKEVLEKTKNSLWGEVLVAPNQFYIKAFSALIGVAVLAMALLFSSHYSLRETVVATIEPQKGKVTLIAPQTGYIYLGSTNQGQEVLPEAILLKIADSPKTYSGESFDDNYKELLSADKERLIRKLALLEEGYKIQKEQVRVELLQNQESLENLKAKHQLSCDNLNVLAARLDHMQEAYNLGGISEVQLEEFALQFRQAKQQTLQEQQGLSKSHLDNNVLVLKLNQLQQSFEEQQVTVEQQIGEIDKRFIEFDKNEGVSIYSPNHMRITQLIVKDGQYVTTGTPLVDLEYFHDAYIASLAIPEHAVGLIENGMPVSLRLHSYPYEHYGVLRGKISSISQSAIFDQNKSAYYYMANVALDRQSILGNGKEYPLRQGLLCQADIKTQKITLIDKLLEPLKRFRKL